MRFLFVLALAFFVITPVMAQTSIAVVDVERVLNEAKAAKALNKERKQAREKLLAELSKKEQSLRDEGKKLFDERKDLSEEEFVKKQKAYEEKLIEMRKTTQKKKRAFEEASNIALDQLKDHLAEAVKAIANEKGYGLVISNRNVIAGEKSLDVTKATVEALDKKKIKIPFKVSD